MTGDRVKQTEEPISRRTFLGRIGVVGGMMAGATAGAVALWQRDHYVPGLSAGRLGEASFVTIPDYTVDTAGRPVLTIARGRERATTIRAAIDALGGIERFVKKGETVLLKPNVAFDRPPSLCATTHPEAVRAVAQLVREAGAGRILVADNPINSPAGCFLKSGIQAVADQMGLECVYPTSGSFETFSMDGRVLTRWPLFHEPLEQADKVIGLAPAKDHNLSRASLTMKNWYGLLGGRRSQFHQDIHRVIADFARMIRPTFVVLDGIEVLKSNGPTGGRLSDVKTMNTVIAGTDMVAVDTAGYELMLERDPAELDYVHRAAERGLGRTDWRELNYKEVQG